VCGARAYFLFCACSRRTWRARRWQSIASDVSRSVEEPAPLARLDIHVLEDDELVVGPSVSPPPAVVWRRRVRPAPVVRRLEDERPRAGGPGSVARFCMAVGEMDSSAMSLEAVDLCLLAELEKSIVACGTRRGEERRGGEVRGGEVRGGEAR
jgi:hypothetical protein